MITKTWFSKKNVLFLDNIVGEDLFNVIKYSHKVVAHHGMMTCLGYLLKKPVLDLFHCKIEKWEDYRRYRNSFYEFLHRALKGWMWLVSNPKTCNPV